MARPDAGWMERLPKDRLIAEFSVWSADLVRLADDMARIPEAEAVAAAQIVPVAIAGLVQEPQAGTDIVGGVERREPRQAGAVGPAVAAFDIGAHQFGGVEQQRLEHVGIERLVGVQVDADTPIRGGLQEERGRFGRSLRRRDPDRLV